MPNDKSSNSNHPIIIAVAACAAAVVAIGAFFLGRHTATPHAHEDAQTREFQASDPTCSICREDILVTQERYLRCGHVFHKTCVEEWLKLRKACPNCNFRFCPLTYTV